jgi:DNA polymerase-3 subunit alpha
MTCTFTHLHVHTKFSLLDGASKPAELIRYAKSLGMDSIAMTDHGNMYGAVEFYEEAKKQGVRPIIGCEVYLATPDRYSKDERSHRYHLILLAENNTGYQNLVQLVSRGYLEGFYRKPRIDKELLRRYHEGLICLSACVSGEIPVHILQRDVAGAEKALQEYLDIFGKDNFFLEMQNHDLPEEQTVNAELRRLARKYDLKLVVTNDIHYVHREDAAAQDVLLCIQTNKTVDDPDRMKFSSADYYCKSYEEMLAKFPDDAEALANTHAIAERCHVDFTFGKLLLPEFPIPKEFANADLYLRSLCEAALPERYADELAEHKDAASRAAYLGQLRQRLEYELGIIKTMGYSSYFLIVRDFINYCRSVKLPVGPGRGSAAGSIVAFLLRITNIDPLKYDLLFERFLNPERISMPDIDTDFCYRRRDEVIQYVIHKYGLDHVALIITFGTLQARAAVRDVGRALGLPLPVVDKVAKAVPRELGITLDKALASSNELKQIYDSDPQVQKLINIARTVEGLPRNSGTHAAGVVIAPRPLIDYVPLQLDPDKSTSGPAMITTQYDKDKVEHLGLLKMDFLGLRTLTVLDDACKFIQADTGTVVDLDNLKVNGHKIPLDDPAVYKMLSEGDTQGVFQMESAGFTKYLMDLEPTKFTDLVAMVAMYRPGPLESGMVEDYIAGNHGHKTAESLHPLIDPILAETNGVILYQEQVMRITSVLAGFSLGEADVMRKAMGKKKIDVLVSMKEKFVAGAARLHQVPREQSEHIFGLLEKFAGYGFNKSHSVAYALVAYETAYLKVYWPAEFFAAFLSSVADVQDKLSWYISVCRGRGLKVLPPDINASSYDFAVENGAIRFGLGGVKSVGSDSIAAILQARNKDGRFNSILDFCKRVEARCQNKRLLENLINCGAMDSLGAHRSQLLAVYEDASQIGQRYQKDHASGQIGLFEDDSFAEVNDIKLPDLDEMPQSLQLKKEKELLGFYVSGHPLDSYKQALAKFTPLHALEDEESTVRDGQLVQVAGLISQLDLRITKKGDSMAILNLEDFTGHLKVVVFPKAYQDCAAFLNQDGVVAVSGRFNLDESGKDPERKILASQVVTLTPAGPEQPLSFAQNRRPSYRVQEETAVYGGPAPLAAGRTGGGEAYAAAARKDAMPAGGVPFTAGSTITPSSVIYLRIKAELENEATQQKLLALFQTLPRHQPGLFRPAGFPQTHPGGAPVLY